LAAHAEVRRIDVRASMGGVQHAKLFVVDGCASYLGSANFDWRSLEHVHELGVEVHEPTVASELLRVFEMDWALAAGEPPPTRAPPGVFPVELPDGTSIAPVLSPRDVLPAGSRWDLPALTAIIDAAERSVRVALLSFQPSFRDGQPFDELDAALRRAGARGVDVRLIVSHWDTRAESLVPLQALQRAPGVTVKIATVEPHASGFIPFARVVHAKYMTIDGSHNWVGTSNWSGDYFFKSRNVGLLIDGAAMAAELEAVHERVWSSPVAEPLDPNRSYPIPRIAQ
jgi:phosphatidylserine/phosphatidylglycerophosphate/cardiolipin synthase-like enzyme